MLVFYAQKKELNMEYQLLKPSSLSVALHPDLRMTVTGFFTRCPE
jgi:hypothetical protein